MVKILLSISLWCFALPAFSQSYPVLSIGVGEEERLGTYSYSLKLIFYVQGGSYLTNVDVTIRSTNGETIYHDVVHAPWLFIHLPSGEYHINATRLSTGEQQSVDIEVDEDQNRELPIMFQHTEGD